jgi:uncharacterized LabA/DUF88 family protein
MRTTFLIDGFNLYHSVEFASRDPRYPDTKWLDIKALCSYLLYMIDKRARIQDVYYFSSLAHHIALTEPDAIVRHKDFIKCLESTGVVAQMGRFKAKDVYCSACGGTTTKYEEKETDVAIGVKLLELFIGNSCDVAVVMTGDTDLVPSVETASRLFPAKKIVVAFPHARKNKEMQKVAHQVIKLNASHYHQFQFLDPVVLADGTRIPRPAKW